MAYAWERGFGCRCHANVQEFVFVQRTTFFELLRSQLSAKRGEEEVRKKLFAAEAFSGPHEVTGAVDLYRQPRYCSRSDHQQVHAEPFDVHLFVGLDLRVRRTDSGTWVAGRSPSKDLSHTHLSQSFTSLWVVG